MNEDQALATGIAQIGIVVADAESTADRYRSLLGIDDWRVNYVDSAEGVGTFIQNGTPTEVSAKIVWADVGGVEIELIEPLRSDKSAFAEFLATQGPGVHHVMLRTASYRQGRDRLASSGMSLLLEGEQQNARFCLFDSIAELGTIVEFAEGGELEADAEL